MSNQKITVELELLDGKYVAKMQGAGQLALKFARDLDRLNGSLDRTERSSVNFIESLRDWTLIIGQARNALNQLAFLTTDWMRSIIRTNAEVERLTFLMRGISSAATEAGRIQEATDSVAALFDMAERAPFSMNTMSNAFVKMKTVGLDPMAGGLQALTDAIAAFGGTDEIFNRAVIGIQQSVGKGVMSMEELRQQIGEAVPQAIGMMASALGTTYAELVEKVGEGVVSAKPALEAMFLEFNRVFGGRAEMMMESYNGQLSLMRTNFTRLVTESAGMRAFFEVVKNGLRDLNTFLSSPQADVLANQIGEALAYVTSSLQSVIQTFWEWRDVITAVGQTLAAFLIGRGAQRIISALSGIRLGFTQLTASVGLTTAAMRNAQIGAAMLATSATGLTRATAVATTTAFAFAGAIRTVAAVALSVVAPLAAAGAAVYALASAMDFFGTARRAAVQRIETGQPIGDSEDAQERVAALDAEEDRLRALGNSIQAERSNLASYEAELASLRQSGVAEDSRRIQDQLTLISNTREMVVGLGEEMAAAEERLLTLSDVNRQQIVSFEQRTAEQLGQTMFDGALRDVNTLRAEYDRRRTEILESSDLKDVERRKANLDNQAKFYDDSIGQLQGFVQRQRDTLTSTPQTEGDLRRGIEASIRLAEEDMVRLRAERAQSLLGVESGIPTISPEEAGGAGGAGGGRRGDSDITRAQREVNEATRDFRRIQQELQNESTRLAASLAAPFSYQTPDAVNALKERLDGVLTQLRQLATESETAAEALALLEGKSPEIIRQGVRNEADRAAIEMDARTREIRRSLMSENDARADVLDEERTRLLSMRDFYTQQGVWRADHETRLNDLLKGLQDQYFRDTETGLQEWMRDWENTNQLIGDMFGETMRGISQELADMITKGEMDLTSFAENILNTFLQIQINSGLSALSGMGGIGDFLNGLFTSGGSGATSTAGVSYAPGVQLHSGGVAGIGGGITRMIPADMFASAPRFHTGGVVGRDEVPAVLRKGEGVFTPEQMAAIGKGMGGGNVEVNVINQTGQQVSASQQQPRFDGRKMILDVVLTAASQPGAFRDGLRGAVR